MSQSVILDSNLSIAGREEAGAYPCNGVNQWFQNAKEHVKSPMDVWIELFTNIENDLQGVTMSHATESETCPWFQSPDI